MVLPPCCLVQRNKFYNDILHNVSHSSYSLAVVVLVVVLSIMNNFLAFIFHIFFLLEDIVVFCKCNFNRLM